MTKTQKTQLLMLVEQLEGCDFKRMSFNLNLEVANVINSKKTYDSLHVANRVANEIISQSQWIETAVTQLNIYYKIEKLILEILK